MMSETPGKATGDHTGKTILIVDDDPTVRLMLKTKLAVEGYEVVCLGSGGEAIDWLKSNRAHLMLLDYQLADTTGGELADQLAEAGLSIPFIVVTAHGDEKLAVKMMKRGALNYLVKDDTLLKILGPTLTQTFDHLERKKALARTEQHLRESEKQYRLLAENISDVIWISDLHLGMSYVSQAVKALTGYTPAEATHQSLIESMTQESADTLLHAINDELMKESRRNEDPDRTITLELEQFHKNGSTIWAEIKIKFLRDQDGEAIGILGISRNVTERREAEERNTQLQAQLHHMHKMEAIGTLAGGVAHDFNNLLTGILGYADMLKRSTKEGEKVYAAAEVIEKAAERARQLTSQLLGFARKGKNQNVSFSIKNMVEEVCELLERTIDKSIRIEVDLQTGNATSAGDPTQMQQVFLNLAFNARDAMPAGGELFMSSEFVELDKDSCQAMPGQKPGRWIKTTVRDTGCGIPKELHDRVFEPFFTTKEAGKGTGMGLAMAYGIVKNHGGSIELTSAPGEGTTFEIYLPVAKTGETSSGIPARGKAIHGTGRILVVDDEEVVRDVAQEMLTELGYIVISACDGVEAVELYENSTEDIDLALIDMIMPKMGGRECFLELKKLNPEIRAVLSTGYGRDGAVQEILDAGMSGFVQKPYRLDQLSAVISATLKGEPSPVALP